HLHAREAFRPALRALRDRREPVRLRAAQALGRIGDRRAIPRLIAALDDPFYTVRYAAQDALVLIGPASIPPLRRAFAAGSGRARPHVVAALAKLGDPAALEFAHRLLRTAPPLLRTAVRQQVAEYLKDARTEDQTH
ncbi:HEAT repeat domain-containing protein, partial [bacterium]|nr:HEAT repeat domain-containing protein [bacterium]